MLFLRILFSLAGLGIVLCLLYLLYRLCTAWDRRRAYERIVIGQVAAVVRQNLALATGLAMAAKSERGMPAVHLDRISRLVAQGVSLSHAIRRGYPDCSGRSLSMITAGEQADQLPAMLDLVEELLVEQGRRGRFVDLPVGVYALLVLGCTILVIGGAMVAVVPKFKAIFADFETTLPWSTTVLIEISEALVGAMAWFLFVLVLVPAGIYLGLRPRKPDSPAWTTRIADWIRWHLPPLRRGQFGQGMAAALHTMQIALRSGLDLDRAARLAADVDVNLQLRPRLGYFADLVAGGKDVGAAAREANLGKVATLALTSGKRSGNMEAALRHAADYHDAIGYRWRIMLSHVSWPLTTLLLGLVAAFIIVALFSPLVALMNSVMGAS